MSDVATRPSDLGPWDRWGWLMAGIWLIFLGFPLTSAAESESPVLGSALIVLYAFIYMGGFYLLHRHCSSGSMRVGLAFVVGLALIVAVTGWVIGWGALGMMAFVVSFAMFTLPLRLASAGFVVVLVVTLGLPLLAGLFGQLWFFTVIVAGVGAGTGLVRVLEDRQVDHQRLSAQTTIAAERERVARDVHDVLGHSLTVISLKADLAGRLMDADPAAARTEVSQIQDLSRQALAEIRSTVGGLRVARLEDELTAARSVLCDAGIEPSMPEDHQVVDPRHRITLAWVLREAVTNVVRHSDARRCAIELGPGLLRVTDDGRGVRQVGEGNGIRGLRERVAAAGGVIDLGPGPDDHGTLLRVQL